MRWGPDSKTPALNRPVRYPVDGIWTVLIRYNSLHYDRHGRDRIVERKLKGVFMISIHPERGVLRRTISKQLDLLHMPVPSSV